MRKLSLKFQVPSFKFQVICLLLMACGLFGLSASAQKVKTSTSKLNIRIGEQFELMLTVEPTSNANLLIDTWFNIPDTFNHFEVLQRMPIDTLEVSGVKSYSQKILLTNYDTGSYQLPVFKIVMVDKHQFATEPLPVKVLPVDISNMQDYHAIKEIIEVEPRTDWLLWAEIGAGIVLLIVLLFFVIRYLSKKKSIKPVKQKALSVDNILQQIDALQPLISTNQYKQLFTQLIIITRNFSDAQLQIASLTKTTDEYMVLLKGKVGNEPIQVQYYQLLRLADAVKFAKFQPIGSECLQALQAAKTFISTMYSFNYQPKVNAL